MWAFMYYEMNNIIRNKPAKITLERKKQKYRIVGVKNDTKRF